ncbi:hypothetical protein JCM8097_009457 [Rhodosporidiobolus ruineniae]
MPKPSAADMLAFQLEQAASNKNGRPSPSPMSAPPSASFGAPPSFHDLDGAAAPWQAPYPSRKASTPASSNGHGYSDGFASVPPVEANGNGRVEAQAPAPTKLTGRTAARKRDEEDEEETDDELEDELNDFGYGAPKRRKEKKESLLDILNSDPPEWMTREPLEPVPLAVVPQRTGTFSKKLRQRFGTSSSSISNGSIAANEDPQAAFSTLRTSRSAGNLLSFSLRSSKRSTTTTSNGNGASHSRDNLSLSGSTTNLILPTQSEIDEFGRLPTLPPSPPQRKLAAKDATSATTESTRDLATFLRESVPPPSLGFGVESALPPRGPPAAMGRGRSKSSSTTGVLHKSRPSRSAYGGVELERTSVDTSTTAATGSTATAPTSSAGAAIVKAAMVNLRAVGRRASLTPFSAQMMIGSPSPVAPTESAPGTPSEDGTGDIRVDEALVSGMFGPPAVRQMGVREFVEADERAAGRFPASPASPVRVVPPRSSSSGVLARSSSVTSTSSLPGSPGYIASPRRLARKPVPSVIPPLEEIELLGLPSSPASSPAGRKPIRDETMAALMRLQERGDTSPMAVGESPIKGAEQQQPQQQRLTTLPNSPLAPPTPTTPMSSVYGTPPITPTSASTVVPSSPSPAWEPKRLSLVPGSSALKDRPISPPPELPLPAPPCAAHAAPIGRPLSLLLTPETPSSLSRAAKRLSTLPAPAPVPPSSSVDSVVDPRLSMHFAPSSSAGSPDNASEVGGVAPIGAVDEGVRVALEALQRCWSEAATLALPPAQREREKKPGEDVEELASAGLNPADEPVSLDALLPTLRAMHQQMQLGAALLGAVLDRVDPQGGGRSREETPRAASDGKGETEVLAEVVEALLGENGAVDRRNCEEDSDDDEQCFSRSSLERPPMVELDGLTTDEEENGFSRFVAEHTGRVDV